jgi:hypothetical protein
MGRASRNIEVTVTTRPPASNALRAARQKVSKRYQEDAERICVYQEKEFMSLEQSYCVSMQKGTGGWGEVKR